MKERKQNKEIKESQETSQTLRKSQRIQSRLNQQPINLSSCNSTKTLRSNPSHTQNQNQNQRKSNPKSNPINITSDHYSHKDKDKIKDNDNDDDPLSDLTSACDLDDLKVLNDLLPNHSKSKRSNSKKSLKPSSAASNNQTIIKSFKNQNQTLSNNHQFKISTPPSLNNFSSPKFNSNSKSFEKFSLDQILLDHRKRTKHQSLDLKRKHDQINQVDLENLPNHLNETIKVTDDLLQNFKNLTKKKSNQKSKSKIESCLDSNLNLNDKTLFDLADQDLSFSTHDVKTLSLDNYPNQSNLLNLLMNDVTSNQSINLTRDAQLRQIFDQSSQNLDPADLLPIRPINLQKVYQDIGGIFESEEEVLNLVKELVDNLEFSFNQPWTLSIDLLCELPSSLTDKKLMTESTSSTQEVIFKILFQPIFQPNYPLQLGERCLYLIESIARQFSLVGSNQLSQVWKNMLELALISLGVFNQIVLENQDDVMKDQFKVYKIAKSDAIDRINLIVRLVGILSSTHCIDLHCSAWFFAIALRLGLEPSSSTLRPEIKNVVGKILKRSNSSEYLNSLMKQFIILARSLETWSNKLELLRFLPLESQFTKWAALGILDLSSAWPIEYTNSDVLLTEAVDWMAHVSNQYTAPPPTRELYNTIKELSKRPYQHYDLNEKEEKGSIRRPFRSPFKDFEEIPDLQFDHLIEIFQISLIGIWDYLVDPKKRDELINHQDGKPKLVGNVWIKLIQQSLEELDNSIKNSLKSQQSAHRVKVKNTICRFSIVLSFLNQTAISKIKRIGQTKLDNFFKKAQ